MRATIATRFSAIILGVVALACASSLGAIILAWRVRELMQTAVQENLPSVLAAEELEIALLEQRGWVSAFMLDKGNRAWLERLQRHKGAFDYWIARARTTAHTPEEHAILDRLDPLYRQYDAKRKEVIALFEAGQKADATRLLLSDMTDLFDRAYNLCEDFIAANIGYVDGATARAEREVAQFTALVVVLLSLTLALGAALLWLFFRRVLFPLRRMVAEATEVASDRAGAFAPSSDELRSVGLYFRALMSDVADARAALESTRSRLRNAEKLASVGKIAASVAHEMRNPLTSVKMWLYSVEKAVGAEEDLRRKLRLISEEITRLENIVRNSLEFSRPPPLKIQPHALSLLLDKTLELIGRRLAERGIRVVRQDAAGLPPVAADADQLKQVFLNLLDNAAEATSQGGAIRLGSTAETSPDGRPMVVVRIRDEGSGIPDDVRHRLFEPFFTTKETGIGLGLCIAAGIMERHRGRLVLESSASQGTCFAVWIPRAEAHADG